MHLLVYFFPKLIQVMQSKTFWKCAPKGSKRGHLGDVLQQQTPDLHVKTEADFFLTVLCKNFYSEGLYLCSNSLKLLTMVLIHYNLFHDPKPFKHRLN